MSEIERLNRYAEALAERHIALRGPSFKDLARAVMAVADAEQAELRAQWWADVCALLNDRADMWETDNRPVLVSELRGLANAFRTYAEGVGIPSMVSLRGKRHAAEARAVAAEAEVKRLSTSHATTAEALSRAVAAMARVEALVDQWERVGGFLSASQLQRLRAALEDRS